MIDYRRKVSMPIRDMHRDGAVAFVVDIYGVTPADIATVGGEIGSRPLRKTVERLSLDPERYQANLWDIPV